MTRRGLTIGCACIVLLALLAPAAPAATPEGPRLAVTGVSLKSFRVTFLTADADGSRPRALLNSSPRRGHRSEPLPSGTISWSPDGQKLVFPAIVGVRRTAHGSRVRTMLFSVAPDGGKPRSLAGTDGAEGPVFSPDGHTIAFARRRVAFQLDHPKGHSGSVFRGTSTWLIDTGGGPARRITPWRNGLETTPSSFSPDGLTLGLTRQVGRGRSEAVALRLDTGAETVLASSAAEPVYSPDGSRIAMVRIPARKHAGTSTTKGNELIVTGADGPGSGEQRLTTPSLGGAALPSWDPSGQRIAFVMFKKDQSFFDLLTKGDSIYEINADGTCPTQVFGASHTLYTGAVWQPGPGREAPPLTC
ncbi:MAG TPA: hypothetical protein VHA54_05755 [Solirubrobacterales bacterium]|nr:hypothetical protein [Solirubrobacterales bacterium]